MANISLKTLFEAEDFKAKSKETGKLVHFKSKDSYQDKQKHNKKNILTFKY